MAIETTVAVVEKVDNPKRGIHEVSIHIELERSDDCFCPPVPVGAQTVSGRPNVC
jgi:hypothetical protein